MKLLYIAFKDFSNLHFGANSKVLSQCKAFEKLGYDVDLIGRHNTDTVLLNSEGKVKKILYSKGAVEGKFKNFHAKMHQITAICSYIEFKKYNACYIRYDFSDFKFIELLKKISNSCYSIALELPTYPYEAENKIGMLNKIKMSIDFHYRKKLKKYIDFIVTFYPGYTELFGIPVILIPNGFDFNSMKLVEKKLPTDIIHVIAVSSMREWHGYERFIEGLNIYYKNNGIKRNFVFHLVGNGREYAKYKYLVESYGLENHVVFEGPMHGQELDELYEICALGIDSLARHRSGISVLSSLKSREYGAKGIPIINSCKIDIIEDDFPYFLQVPANELPIDIKSIETFYDFCYNNENSRQDIAKKIRSYISKKCDMETTLTTVSEGFKNKM